MVTWSQLITIAHRRRRAPPQLEAIPLVQLPGRPENPPPRKILKAGDKDPSLPSFGPLHRGERPLFSSMKEEAWQLVLTRSQAPEDVTREAYVTAMGRIEQKARNSYAEINHLTGFEFKEMMIKDGCFFLHLALLILGPTEQLGYPEDHGYFGKDQSKQHIRRWMKAMLVVGNQIPVVAIRELMKQKYFQEVVRDHGKWEQPKGILRRALHGLLGLPATGGAVANWEESVVDLLHGLQRLVLGSGPKPPTEKDQRNNDLDLESGGDDDVINCIDNEQRFLSATEMKGAGIHFKRGAAGIKDIHFSTNFLWTRLYLPDFVVDAETELLFQSLIDYETCQKPSNGNKCEVTSYLRLMRDMVRTTEDVKILEKCGIIVSRDLRYTGMLPGILRRLKCENRITPQLHTVMVLTSNYSRPALRRILKMRLNAVLLLTAVQTVYVILAFHFGKMQS